MKKELRVIGGPKEMPTLWAGCRFFEEKPKKPEQLTKRKVIK